MQRLYLEKVINKFIIKEHQILNFKIFSLKYLKEQLNQEILDKETSEIVIF